MQVGRGSRILCLVDLSQSRRVCVAPSGSVESQVAWISANDNFPLQHVENVRLQCRFVWLPIWLSAVSRFRCVNKVIDSLKGNHERIVKTD